MLPPTSCTVSHAKVVPVSFPGAPWVLPCPRTWITGAPQAMKPNETYFGIALTALTHAAGNTTVCMFRTLPQCNPKRGTQRHVRCGYQDECIALSLWFHHRARQ